MFRGTHLIRTLALGLLIAAVAAPGWADYKRIHKAKRNDPMKVEIFRLDNGLTVYLTENHETPRFYAEIAVRAGSKFDPAESTGLAHYLEHLLFKGTDRLGSLDYEKEEVHLKRIEELYQQHFSERDPAKRKAIYAEINAESLKAAEYAAPNEMDVLYKAMGVANINAFTSTEQTVFLTNLPSNRLQQWAMIESERFRKPVYRLFQPELETVYEELNRILDNKQWLIHMAVDEALFKVHPYGQQTVIGTVEHLKNPSLKNIGIYFDTYYKPNNMAIFISGNIDTEEAMAVIDEYFSVWEPVELPEPKVWEEAPLTKREQVEVNYEGEEYVLLAFRTASQNDKDAEALMLLDMILDNATAGLINLNLNQQQRVRQAGSYPRLQNDYGAQYLYAIPKDGQTLEEAEALLLEQIDIIKRGEFGDWLLPAIVNDFKKNRKGAMEQDDARVDLMRSSWIAEQDWDFARKQIRRMEKVTKEDVVRVANAYFSGGYVAGFRRDAPHEVPDIEKPELAKLNLTPGNQSEFAAQLLAVPVSPLEPVFVDPEKDFTREEDPKGVTYYHVENPLNDLFNLGFTIDVGKYEDNTLNLAVQLLNKSGTVNYSPEELQKEWYKLGTEFGLGSGDNETNIWISGLDENFEESVALMMELLRQPACEASTLEDLKDIIVARREDAKKQADEIAGAVRAYNLHQEESSYLRMLPEAEMRRMTVADLHGAIGKLLGYKHTIRYTGSLPLEKVISTLRKYYPVDAPLQDPPPYRFLKARETDKTEIYLFDKETAKATIRAEFGGPDFDDTITVPTLFFNSYFAGGLSGIVYQELRESRGLVYYAGARYYQGGRIGDQDLLTSVVQTQNDKAAEALGALLGLMEDMPVEEERFAVTQAGLLNRYRTAKIGFRDIIDAVRGWEKQGLTPDPRAARYEQVGKTALDDLLGFHRDYITGRPLLISIVGDKAKMDMAALAEIGTIREIESREIFVDEK